MPTLEACETIDRSLHGWQHLRGAKQGLVWVRFGQRSFLSCFPALGPRQLNRHAPMFPACAVQIRLPISLIVCTARSGCLEASAPAGLLWVGDSVE